MERIIVSDITLKVIESDKKFTFREKLNVCAALNRSGADAIELPALIGSKESEVIYRTIAGSVKGAEVRIDAGQDADSIALAYNCVKCAEKPVLQIVLPISTVTMEYLYHYKASAMLERMRTLITIAKSTCDRVELVVRDAFRADKGFAAECAALAAECGAFAITLCDDAGEALPDAVSALVAEVKAAADIEICVQTSDALSLSAACAIEAVKSGAVGVKTSVVGEYLRPAVIADIIRAKGAELGLSSSLDVTGIKSISAAICETEKIAAAREEEKSSVAPVRLDEVSSMRDVALAVKELGYELSDEDMGKVYDEVKRVCVRKKMLEKKELEAIVASTAMQVPSTYHLINFVVNSGNIIPATANVTLEKDGERYSGVSTGDGPIDAAFHAIEQVIGHHYELDDFQVQAVTKGREAVGESVIRLRAKGKLYSGSGVSTDIIGACIRAFVNALNKIVYEEN